MVADRPWGSGSTPAVWRSHGSCTGSIRHPRARDRSRRRRRPPGAAPNSSAGPRACRRSPTVGTPSAARSQSRRKSRANAEKWTVGLGVHRRQLAIEPPGPDDDRVNRGQPPVSRGGLQRSPCQERFDPLAIPAPGPGPRRRSAIEPGRELGFVRSAGPDGSEELGAASRAGPARRRGPRPGTRPRAGRDLSRRAGSPSSRPPRAGRDPRRPDRRSQPGPARGRAAANRSRRPVRRFRHDGRHHHRTQVRTITRFVDSDPAQSCITSLGVDGNLVGSLPEAVNCQGGISCISCRCHTSTGRCGRVSGRCFGSSPARLKASGFGRLLGLYGETYWDQRWRRRPVQVSDVLLIPLSVVVKPISNRSWWLATRRYCSFNEFLIDDERLNQVFLECGLDQVRAAGSARSARSLTRKAISS